MSPVGRCYSSRIEPYLCRPADSQVAKWSGHPLRSSCNPTMSRPWTRRSCPIRPLLPARPQRRLRMRYRPPAAQLPSPQAVSSVSSFIPCRSSVSPPIQWRGPSYCPPFTAHHAEPAETARIRWSKPPSPLPGPGNDRHTRYRGTADPRGCGSGTVIAASRVFRPGSGYGCRSWVQRSWAKRIFSRTLSGRTKG